MSSGYANLTVQIAYSYILYTYMNKPRIHIYYDGECKMCTAFANTVSSNDNQATLVDAQTATLTSLKKEDLLYTIHLVEGDGKVRTGPDAVLTAFSRIYSWLTPLAQLFRLPVFNWFASFVYFYISARRKYLFGGDSSRLFWLFLITNIGLLAGVILSLPLWESIRSYPTIAVLPSFSFLQPYTSLLTAFLLASLTLGILLTKQFRWFALASAIFLAMLFTLDITRLQPWVWHYLATLLVLSFWLPHSPLRNTKLLDAARYIVVGIYFWSGLQKINTAFFLETFPWFTEPYWSHFGITGQYAVLIIGIFVPFFESAFALGLLTKRFRKISIIGSAIMLLVVMSCLVFGHSWNTSVWPWNLAIFGMVLILFLGLPDTFGTILNRTKSNLFAIIAIALIILAPLGNFFGLTDHYLAWSLYSGHVPTATLIASPQTILAIAPNARFTPIINSEAVSVEFTQLSTASMNVVPYPEVWVFESIFETLCQEYKTDTNLLLTIDTRPFFNSLQIKSKDYTCPPRR